MRKQIAWFKRELRNPALTPLEAKLLVWAFRAAYAAAAAWLGVDAAHAAGF